ncbi:MAG: M20/M25/M40 family metallo-hydrolase [Planctomycetota bacterium]
MRDRIITFARDLCAIPTAPFREAGVRAYIRQFCAARGIRVREDDMGNLVVRHGGAARGPVLAFCAHMDHPGFIIEKDSRGGRTTALFYGRVGGEYIKTGRVRVFTAAGDVRGRITRYDDDKRQRLQRVHLAVAGSVRRGDMAMWELPAFKLAGDLIHTRSCDDTLGCVSVLALLDELVRRKIKRPVLGVFSVAEEGGLHGAKYMAMQGFIPKNAYLVAIETSSALAGAKIGGGVVVRVGDRMSVFAPAMTAFLADTARDLAGRDKKFTWQRKLMDGGTCETTIYQQFGYRSGAVCVPLGNYHNRDDRKVRIVPEYLSVHDMECMVQLFIASVKRAAAIPAYYRPQRPVYKEERRPLGERLFF